MSLKRENGSDEGGRSL